MVARSVRHPSPRFLEFLYPLPRWLRTLEEFDRLHHRDLPGLTDLGLSIELSNVWRRICLERPPADAWLFERRSALFAERDRRRAAGRRP